MTGLEAFQNFLGSVLANMLSWLPDAETVPYIETILYHVGTGLRILNDWIPVSEFLIAGALILTFESSIFTWKIIRRMIAWIRGSG